MYKAILEQIQCSKIDFALLKTFFKKKYIKVLLLQKPKNEKSKHTLLKSPRIYLLNISLTVNFSAWSYAFIKTPWGIGFIKG